MRQISDGCPKSYNTTGLIAALLRTCAHRDRLADTAGLGSDNGPVNAPPGALPCGSDGSILRSRNCRNLPRGEIRSPRIRIETRQPCDRTDSPHIREQATMNGVALLVLHIYYSTRTFGKIRASYIPPMSIMTKTSSSTVFQTGHCLYHPPSFRS
jgi:hypothetical protein